MNSLNRLSQIQALTVNQCNDQGRGRGRKAWHRLGIGLRRRDFRGKKIAPNSNSKGNRQYCGKHGHLIRICCKLLQDKSFSRLRKQMRGLYGNSQTSYRKEIDFLGQESNSRPRWPALTIPTFNLSANAAIFQTMELPPPNLN